MLQCARQFHSLRMAQVGADFYMPFSSAIWFDSIIPSALLGFHPLLGVVVTNLSSQPMRLDQMCHSPSCSVIAVIKKSGSGMGMGSGGFPGRKKGGRGLRKLVT